MINFNIRPNSSFMVPYPEPPNLPNPPSLPSGTMFINLADILKYLNFQPQTTTKKEEKTKNNETEIKLDFKKPPKIITPTIIKALMPESVKGYFKRR